MKIDLLIAMALIMVGCDQQEKTKTTESTNSSAESVSPAQKTTADKNSLAGDWIRTDAEYWVQISDLSDDGMMKAAYFNPKSINVSKATWSSTDRGFKIYIELRDENYPGSNYTLIYSPEKDVLDGKYYQAVEAVTYEVAFVRKK